MFSSCVLKNFAKLVRNNDFGAVGGKKKEEALCRHESIDTLLDTLDTNYRDESDLVFLSVNVHSLSRWLSLLRGVL